jgi:hypothetical protein
MAAGLGEAIGGLISDTKHRWILSGMLGLIANFMGDLGKQLIAGCGSIAFKSVRESFCGRGRGCGFSRFILYFSNTKSRTKKHKLSPMVESWVVHGTIKYYRVNSGELVLNNSDQQSKLYGQMNSRWWC